jgi:anti-anti-sigma factor
VSADLLIATNDFAGTGDGVTRRAVAGGAIKPAGVLQPAARSPDPPRAHGSLSGGKEDLLTLSSRPCGRSLYIIAVVGELDIATAPVLVRELGPVADRGGHLVLDLSRLRFCDCSGLNVLDLLRRRAAVSGGSVRLLAIIPALRRLITLARMTDLLSTAVGLADVTGLARTQGARRTGAHDENGGRTGALDGTETGAAGG